MRPALALIGALCALILAAPAGAVVGGGPDSAHPYVGLLDNGSEGCSGTAISSRVIVTAAHCFAGGSLWGTDQGQPRIRVTFDQQGIFNPNRVSYFGAFYADPAFCSPCGPGSKSFDGNDVAVVILDSPVVMSTYGRLPSPGFDDSLPTNTRLDVVGYGVQAFLKPAVPDLNAVLTRDAATAKLVSVESQFLKISSAQCSGDSGGPVLLAGTSQLVAEVSYHANPLCNGVAYDMRLDDPGALAWIAQTVAAHS
jgi:secreted trypsin-like serine protease